MFGCSFSEAVSCQEPIGEKGQIKVKWEGLKAATCSVARA